MFPDAPQASFEAILDSVFAFVGVFDTEHRVIGANQASLDAAELSREELIGLHVKDTPFFKHSPDAQTSLQEMFDLALAGEKVRKRLGARLAEREVTLDAVVGPFYIDGEVAGVVGTGVDVSAQLAAERAETKSRRRLAEAQRVGMVGLWEDDLVNSTFWWSDELFLIHGMEPGEELSLELITSLIHPDDRDLVAQTCATAMREKAEQEVVFRIVRPDGQIRHVRLRGRTIYDDEDNPSRNIGTIQDITHRVASEQLLRDAFDGLPIYLAIVDLAGKVLEVNDTALRGVGHTRDEVIGTQFGDSPWFRDLPEEQERIEKMIACATRGEVFVDTFRVMNDAGEVVYLEGMWSPLRNEQGEIDRVIGSGVNITERILAERRQRQLEEEIERTRRLDALGRLASGIAHDFNNLLGSISGNLEIARFFTDDAPPELVESLDEIAIATHRATKLVRQVLTFGRTKKDGEPSTPLTPILEEALSLIRMTATDDVNFVVNDEAGNVEVACDPTKLHQVLTNLGTNARQAIGAEGGTVTIETSVESNSGAGGFLHVVVSDDGSGMDDATLEQIFEPFFTTKSPDEGTGLGLAVTHGIVAAHGGTIEFDSTPGVGTSAHLRLPLAAADTLSEQPKTTRVLFIDDEVAITGLHDHLLEFMGYEVTSFNAPKEALAALERHADDFDVVVTDYSMPGLDGLDVASHLEEIRPDLPIVIMSGRVTPEPEQTRRNVATTLPKPFSTDQLANAIETALGRTAKTEKPAI